MKEYGWMADWHTWGPRDQYARLRYGRKFWSHIPARERMRRLDKLSIPTETDPDNRIPLSFLLRLRDFNSHPVCHRAPWKRVIRERMLRYRL